MQGKVWRKIIKTITIIYETFCFGSLIRDEIFWFHNITLPQGSNQRALTTPIPNDPPKRRALRQESPVIMKDGLTIPP